MMNETAVTVGGLQDDLAAALNTAHEAQEAHQAAALAAVENRATARELEKAADTLQRATRQVSTLRAAIVAAEGREKRQAEEAEAAARAAALAALEEHLKGIAEAGAQWDSAVDALVAASGVLDSAMRRIHEVHPPASLIQKLESARSNAMTILGERLHPFTGPQHRPPFFPEHLAKLASHLPTPDAVQ